MVNRGAKTYLALILAVFAVATYAVAPIPGFRPPSVPLIVNDPYLSIWSNSNNLFDSWATLWDGTTKAFSGMIRIDGAVFRFMGPGSESGGSPANPMTQESVMVYPTRTIYKFTQSGVRLTLTFSTPAITTDMDLLSRPVTYLSYDVETTDGKSHSVQLYYDNTAEIAVDQITESVVWSRQNTPGGLQAMRVGTSAQKVLGKSGDGVGINWGYFYVAAATGQGMQQSMGPIAAIRTSFASSGKLPGDNNNDNIPADQTWPGLAVAWDLGSVSSKVSCLLVVAYDDILSMNYFGNLLAPLWKQKFSSALALLDASHSSYATLAQQLTSFDVGTLADLSSIGGDQYATICALAYRQTLAGTKLVWNDKLKTPWYFMKEISSDGDVSTVDVIFPASPFFLYYNPKLLDMLFIPVMEYANNKTDHPYSLPWAPHHLGQWPIANIQTNQQENMPIEETGNLLLMLAATVKKNGDLTTTKAYRSIFEAWGQYLTNPANLPDPGNQLCTDDFEGPTPHDANLAVKGIVAIAAIGYLEGKLGNANLATKFNTTAGNYAKQFMKLANPDNTNHYRLRYDQPGWSLKYNLLFQYLLDLPVFPQSVIQQEVAYYMQNLNKYGVPLDVRASFTKLDWLSWVAAMAPSQSDSNTMISAIYKFADETPTRVPLSDWYDTKSGAKSGFQARTVVGGFYAKAALAKK